ncbi:Hypothetical protein P9515_16441 [Prochlorococcus marinus str. MIT 9515]|uniref:Uncharacterized protein n=1 Tax=Prochlorococcus marinus (strain MIT 9515) TaxID=167542 RepID=A2BYJ0_PROM5|nr:Hypothetical protein P9515_16441 [Prochlorococcus marinus str. MIT 9515]
MKHNAFLNFFKQTIPIFYKDSPIECFRHFSKKIDIYKYKSCYIRQQFLCKYVQWQVDL